MESINENIKQDDSHLKAKRALSWKEFSWITLVFVRLCDDDDAWCVKSNDSFQQHTCEAY